MKRKLFLYVLVALVSAAGCAKKRPIAQVERGTIVGAVDVDRQLRRELRNRFRLTDAGYCFQAVRLDQTKQVVIEMSSGTCPEGLSGSVLVTFSMYADPAGSLPDKTKGTLLLAGSAISPSDRSPVGLVSLQSRRAADGASIPVYVMSGLCTDVSRFNLGNSCEMVSDAKGSLVEFKYDRSTTLSTHMIRLGLINIENAERVARQLQLAQTAIFFLRMQISAASKRLDDVSGRRTTLSSQISDLETRADALDVQIAALNKRDSDEVQPILKRVEDLEKRSATLVGDALKLQLDSFDARLANLERRRTDLFTAEKLRELSELETRVSTLKGQIDTVLSDKTRIQLNALIARVDPLKRKVDYLLAETTSQELANLENRVRVLEPKLAALEDTERLKKLSALEKQVGKVEQTLASILSDAMKSKVDALQPRVEALHTKLLKLISNESARALERLESRLVAIEIQIQKVDRSSAVSKDLVAKLTAEQQSLQERVLDLVNGPMAAQIDQIEESIDNASKGVDSFNTAQLQSFMRALEAANGTELPATPAAVLDDEAKRKIEELRSRYQDAKKAIVESRDSYLDRTISNLEQTSLEALKRPDTLKSKADRAQAWSTVSFLLKHKDSLTTTEYYRLQAIEKDLFNQISIEFSPN